MPGWSSARNSAIRRPARASSSRSGEPLPRTDASPRRKGEPAAFSFDTRFMTLPLIGPRRGWVVSSPRLAGPVRQLLISGHETQTKLVEILTTAQQNNAITGLERLIAAGREF